MGRAAEISTEGFDRRIEERKRCRLVMDFILIALEPNTTAGYITYLLRHYRDLLSNKYQIKLANTLSTVTDDLPVSLRMLLLELLLF